MKTRYKVLIVVGALLSAFAAGRFSTPEKIKVETKIVEVEKKRKDTNLNKKSKKTTKTVTRPDGTKETTTVVETDTKKDTKEVTERDKKTDSVTETTKGGNKTSISVIGGIGLAPGTVAPAPAFGAHVQRQILGPFTLGIWGLSNVSGGVSLGIMF